MFKKYVSYQNTRLLTDSLRGCRFQPSTDIAGQTPVKSSVQRSIRSAVLNQWSIDAETLEQMWPKKESLVHVKWSVSCPHRDTHAKRAS
jgi:hypothetical protein